MSATNRSVSANHRSSHSVSSQENVPAELSRTGTSEIQPDTTYRSLPGSSISATTRFASASDTSTEALPALLTICLVRCVRVQLPHPARLWREGCPLTRQRQRLSGGARAILCQSAQPSLLG